MNHARSAALQRVAVTLLAAVLLAGCAAPKSKRTAETAPAQASATRTVILVPIFILSPSDNEPVEKNPAPPREMAPPRSVDRPDRTPANPAAHL